MHIASTTTSTTTTITVATTAAAPGAAATASITASATSSAAPAPYSTAGGASASAPASSTQQRGNANAHSHAHSNMDSNVDSNLHVNGSGKRKASATGKEKEKEKERSGGKGKLPGPNAARGDTKQAPTLQLQERATANGGKKRLTSSASSSTAAAHVPAAVAVAAGAGAGAGPGAAVDPTTQTPVAAVGKAKSEKARSQPHSESRRGSKASSTPLQARSFHAVAPLLEKLATAHDTYIASGTVLSSGGGADSTSSVADASGNAPGNRANRGAPKAATGAKGASSATGLAGASDAVAEAPLLCVICRERGPDIACTRCCSGATHDDDDDSNVEAVGARGGAPARWYHFACLPELRAAVASGANSHDVSAHGAANSALNKPAGVVRLDLKRWICPPCRREVLSSNSTDFFEYDSRALAMWNVAAGLAGPAGTCEVLVPSCSLLSFAQRSVLPPLCAPQLSQHGLRGSRMMPAPFTYLAAQRHDDNCALCGEGETGAEGVPGTSAPADAADGAKGSPAVSAPDSETTLPAGLAPEPVPGPASAVATQASSESLSSDSTSSPAAGTEALSGGNAAANGHGACSAPGAGEQEEDESGRLVLCDGPGCTKVYHVRCAPDLAAAGRVPEGDWYCPSCAAALCGSPTVDTDSPAAAAEQQPSSSPGTLAGTATASSNVAGESASGSAAPAAVPPAPGRSPTGADTFAPAPASIDTDLIVDESALVPLPPMLQPLLAPSKLFFDGYLNNDRSGFGVEELRDIRAKAAELAAAEEARHPPPYKHVARCVYVGERPKRKRAGAHDDDGERCNCSSDASKRGCVDGCVNRVLFLECNSHNCGYGGDPDRLCSNRSLQRRVTKKVIPKPTGGKGWGLFAGEAIAAGEFVMEYVGEILDDAACEQRLREYKAAGERHYYLLEITREQVIDAGRMGNETRFINHSCNANCEAHKRRVGDDTRIGIFACRDIAAGEEITYDYQYTAFTEDRWRCQCGAANCRGYLGANRKEAQTSERAAVFVGTDGAGSGAGAKGAGPAFRLHPLDATIFYSADASRRTSALTIMEAHPTISEMGFARARNLLRLGRPVPAPNAYDETEGSHTPSRVSRPRGRHATRRRWASVGKSASCGADAGAAVSGNGSDSEGPDDTVTEDNGANGDAISAASSRLRKRPRLGASPEDAAAARTLLAALPGHARGTLTPAMRLRNKPSPGLLLSRYSVLQRTFTLRLFLCAWELAFLGLMFAPLLQQRDGSSADANTCLSLIATRSCALIRHCHGLCPIASTAGMERDLNDRIESTVALPDAVETQATGAAVESAAGGSSLPAAVAAIVPTLLPHGVPANQAAHSFVHAWATALFLRDEDVDDDGSGHEAMCARCSGTGNLVCCDGCPRAFHLSCVMLYDIPQGKWLCPDCKRAARSRDPTAAVSAVSIAEIPAAVAVMLAGSGRASLQAGSATARGEQPAALP